MKLSEYAKHLGVTYRTAWNHFKKGSIEGAYQLPSGTIIVPEPGVSKEERVAIYARVSSSQNRDNLETQAGRLRSFCAAKGYQVEKVVKEVGSGINDQRPKLLSLLRDDTITLIVVEHKDRLTRMGFNYIKQLLVVQGRDVEVINEAEEEEREDLMQDLVSIITSFVARYYGRRRSHRKTERLIKVLQEEEI